MTGPSGRPLLILALHLALLGGGIAYAWSALSSVAAQQSSVDQIRATIEQLDRRLAAGGVHAAAAPPTGDLLLAGESATVAGANLQDRVVSAIRSAGGTVTSSQLDTGGSRDPGSNGLAPPVVLLTVTCVLGNAALQGLLYRMESSAPALLIDQISIEGVARTAGDPGPGGTDTLKIAMTVSAYWTGEGKS